MTADGHWEVLEPEDGDFKNGDAEPNLHPTVDRIMREMFDVLVVSPINVRQRLPSLLRGHTIAVPR